MEYRPTFFKQIIEAFLVRTEPASSIVKPAHIHITSAPQTKNENVLSMKAVSALGAAWASTVTTTVPSAVASAARFQPRAPVSRPSASLAVVMASPYVPQPRAGVRARTPT